jgi:hypothetical protein
MRKNIIRSLILTVCVLFACCGCQTPRNTKDSKPTTRVDLEIVYKRNQMCYAIMAQGEDTNLYVFNAAAQPIFDQEGKSATAANIIPGMLVSLEYDGYILETYPAQFSGVSSIRATGIRANSVEFMGTLISGMFPSATPDEVERWEISFEGEQFLSAKEERALEHMISEEWVGSQVVVNPKESYTKKTGYVVVTTEKAGEDKASLTIRVDSGVEGSRPTERKMTVSIKDGRWSM